MIKYLIVWLFMAGLASANDMQKLLTDMEESGARTVSCVELVAFEEYILGFNVYSKQVMAVRIITKLAPSDFILFEGSHHIKLHKGDIVQVRTLEEVDKKNLGGKQDG